MTLQIKLFISLSLQRPVRKYYARLSKRTRNNDRFERGGQYEEDALTSIRVDKGHSWNPPVQRTTNHPAPTSYQVPGILYEEDALTSIRVDNGHLWNPPVQWTTNHPAPISYQVPGIHQDQSSTLSSFLDPK